MDVSKLNNLSFKYDIHSKSLIDIEIWSEDGLTKRAVTESDMETIIWNKQTIVFILEKRNDKTGEIIFDSEKYSTTNPSGFTTEEYIRCLTIFENKRRASFEFTKVSTNCMYIYYDGVVFIHKNGLVVYWDRDPLKTRTNDED